MMQMPRQKITLAMVLALTGTFAVPQNGMAQAGYQPNVGGGSVGEGITPYVGSNNLVPTATGDDGSARDVTGQTSLVNVANPYAPQYTDGTQPVWNGDGDPMPGNSSRRETGTERAGRYFGASRNTGDLTAAAYGGDEDNSVRGKTALKPNRLGVFGKRNGDPRPLVIKPYIEAGQVVQADLSPRSDVVTYTSVAVGVDALVNGHNNQGIISLRYERRYGWGNASNSDSVTGIARMSTAIIPDTLRIDYGGYAGKTRIAQSGAAISANGDAKNHIYSAYVGPTLTTHAGDVAVTGHYYIGYSKVGTSDGTVTAAGAPVGDVFDHSTVHDARLAAGVRPGEVLPVGLSVEGGYYQENVSNLDQRVKDSHVRGEITIPVSDDVALVGGIGYEKTQITSHDAVRDINGNPVSDLNGRLITDFSSPRYIAFDSDGMIWDAGVTWRPSRRTNMEIHVGKRYGEIGAYGFLTYQPDERNSFNIVAYNNIAGFGGALTNSLYNMPSQFSTVRDALTGNLTSCVATSQGGGCLAGALGSVNSTVYRGRGVSASYNRDMGRWRGGFGLGYDRRQYVAAIQTALGGLNGKVDQYYWVGAFVGGNVTEHSTIETTLDAYRFQSGLSSTGDLTAFRSVSIYQYFLSRNLTANASMSIDGISRQALDDIWSAAGSVGMRYTF